MNLLEKMYQPSNIYFKTYKSWKIETKSPTFNKIPETDEDVASYFNEIYQDSLVRACVFGIYELRRAQGFCVISSYKYALEAYIESKQKKTNKV